MSFLASHQIFKRTIKNVCKILKGKRDTCNVGRKRKKKVLMNRQRKRDRFVQRAYERKDNKEKSNKNQRKKAEQRFRT